MRPLTILVVHPGAAISTADVFDGVVAGLAHAGARVITYSLHGRIKEADRTLHAAWRVRRKKEPGLPKPTVADIVYQSSMGLFEKLYRFEPEVVLFVSGVLLVGEIFRLVRKRHTAAVLLTESPYLMEQEQLIAAAADIAWTHERAALAGLREAQPETHYLPHAWLPGRHDRPLEALPEMPAHDVVFVGTGFAERIALLEAVDWTGIDLGLYGQWSQLRADSPLQRFVRGGTISNVETTALYRRAKIGLNLYRTTTDGTTRPLRVTPECLNPRAYELAACGVFTLSEPRAEVLERFGPLVPTFSSAAELSALLRRWLADDAGRAEVAARLPACVAEETWLARGRQLLTTLRDVHARAHAA